MEDIINKNIYSKYISVVILFKFESRFRKKARLSDYAMVDSRNFYHFLFFWRNLFNILKQEGRIYQCWQWKAK